MFKKSLAIIAAEARRVAEIREKIAGIRGLPLALAGAGSEDIAAERDALAAFTPPLEVFAEFTEECQTALREAIAALDDLHARVKGQEAAAALVEAERQRLAELERQANERAAEAQRLADEAVAAERARAEAAERELAALRAQIAAAQAPAPAAPPAEPVSFDTAMRAVLPAPVAAVVQVTPGYKLVPVEPTPEMIHAGRYGGDEDAPPMGSRPVEGETAWPFCSPLVAAKIYRAMLAAAPEAPAQGDHIDWKLMREARDALAEWANTGTINGFDVEGLIASMSLSLELHGKPAQAIPAPWREAVKVARWALEGWANHGTWVWPESALEQCKRNTTEALAALAQLDALEGGE